MLPWRNMMEGCGHCLSREYIVEMGVRQNLVLNLSHKVASCCIKELESLLQEPPSKLTAHLTNQESHLTPDEPGPFCPPPPPAASPPPPDQYLLFMAQGAAPLAPFVRGPSVGKCGQLPLKRAELVAMKRRLRDSKWMSQVCDGNQLWERIQGWHGGRDRWGGLGWGWGWGHLALVTRSSMSHTLYSITLREGLPHLGPDFPPPPQSLLFLSHLRAE